MTRADSPADDAPIPLVAIACIGIATLMFEILLTRIFSVTMWYHFAFVTISLALFGIAASGVLVMRSEQLSDRKQSLQQMAMAAACFGGAVPLAFVLDLHVPFRPFDVPGQRLQAGFFFLIKFLVLALPFFYSGLVLALAFTHSPNRVNRVYFADLAGGGLGCGLVVPVMLVLSGPSATIATAVFPFVAAALLYRQSGNRRGMLATLAAAVAVLVFVGVNEQVGIVKVVHVKSFDAKLGRVLERPKVYEKWHPVSRVAVHPLEYSPKEAPERWFHTKPVEGGFPHVMHVTNDGAAGTHIYPKLSQADRKRIFRHDVSDLVYSLVKRPNVLVVGVGGGKDILSALAFDCNSVTAAELNPLMIDVVQNAFADFSGRPYDDPRVKIHINEARNFIASRPDRYDVIKISVTDTWTASARGAYSLNENYLYTREAMNDYLSHLTPGGFLTITRWYPHETLRLAMLLRQTLLARGQDPAKCILMARCRQTLTCLVKNGELTAEEQRQFADACHKAEVVMVQADAPDVSTEPEDVWHRQVITGEGLDALLARLPINLNPPTDDHPFFFDLSGKEGSATLDKEANFLKQHARAHELLIGLLILTSIVALLFVVLPVVLFRRKVRAERVPTRTWLLANLYFLSLGIGFMLVEIPLLQRLILFLGHPTYAMTVVLMSLLISSGIGSLTAGWLLQKGVRPAWLLATNVLVLVVSTQFMPDLLRAEIGLPIAGRIAMATALIFPVGLLLGMPFPTGLRLAHRHEQALVPWAWAVNGAASVAAPCLAMIISMQYSFSFTLYVGTAIYALATLLLVVWNREPGGVIPNPA